MRRQVDRWENLKTLAGTGGEVSGYTLNYATNGSGAPATNQILNINGTIPVVHDAAGNMTSEGSTSYSFDAAGRLREVGTGGQNVYGYDGDGRRVRQVAGGGSPLLYVWSTVLGEVAYEATSGESAVRAYLYAGKRQIALRGTDRGFYWVHSDHLGSLKKLTRTNGTVAYRVEYDPHGQRVMEWSDVNVNLDSHKFTGHEFDSSTGLEYAKARMLSHNRGRFNQPDLLALTAVDLEYPQSLNRYSYTHNDPVNFVDRNGKDDEPVLVREETWEPGPERDINEIFEDYQGKPTKSDGKGGGGPKLDPRWEIIKAAIATATNALTRKACKDLVAGPAESGGDPAKLLAIIASKIKLGLGTNTLGTGLNAVIQLDEFIFFHHSLNLSMSISSLTEDLAIAQAVEILHELSHATGANTHPGYKLPFPGVTKEIDPTTLNASLFKACFGG